MQTIVTLCRNIFLENPVEMREKANLGRFLNGVGQEVHTHTARLAESQVSLVMASPASTLRLARRRHSPAPPIHTKALFELIFLCRAPSITVILFP